MILQATKDHFIHLAISGAGSTWKPLTPTSRGLYLGLDSAVTGGIEIVTDSGGNQYVDLFNGR